MVTEPPVPVVAPVWLPACKVREAPVPVSRLELPGWIVMGVAVEALEVVISAAWLPARVSTPAVETFKLEEVSW